MITPNLRGLDKQQAALVRAWCALYPVAQFLNDRHIVWGVGKPAANMERAYSFRLATCQDTMTCLKEICTAEAATRCAQWERRYWQARASLRAAEPKAQYLEVADDKD